jgi:DNA recombination protein RmuC
MLLVGTIVALAVGLGFGLAAALVLTRRQQAASRLLAAELREQAAAAAGMASARELDVRKQHIDRELDTMSDQLAKMCELVGALEKDRERKFGELANQLQATVQVTSALGETTNSLRQALASPKARGQWGERMAEDVLRLAGFVEGVNYEKQRTLRVGGGRPDFTFPLPKGHVVHMDAKFPVAAYLRFLDCDTDAERDAHRSQFVRDVRQRVRELATRDYVDPEQGTVDYVLCFIPNETVYGFIHESDATLMDDALRQKVVFCSPLSLFAVLAVIRQAFDNFVMEQTSNEILGLLGAFAGQYQKFCGQLEKLGRQLDGAGRAYADLAGTRRRQLERPLEKLEELRRQRGIDAIAGLSLADLDGAGDDDGGEGGEGGVRSLSA